MNETEFQPFPKIARLNREIVITEKIDGTNAQIFIDDTGTVIKAGSRNRWLRDCEDNHGFYKWVMENREELLKLGPGRHFGEWWGCGIQRGYGLKEKRFSLFNAGRWVESPVYTMGSQFLNPNQSLCPACCHVVPVLYQGPFSQREIEKSLFELAGHGSTASPGFLQPEGIVVFHTAAKALFKVTLKDDEKPKGAQ